MVVGCRINFASLYFEESSRCTYATGLYTDVTWSWLFDKLCIPWGLKMTVKNKIKNQKHCRSTSYALTDLAAEGRGLR